MLDFEAVKELLGGLLLRPCLVGAFAFLAAGVLGCLCGFCRKHLVGLWLHSRSQFVALVIAAGIATGVAQKTTNNVPPNLNSPLPQMMQGGISQAGFVGEGNLENPVQTSLDDIARGYRQESMTTNLEPFAEMPSNAVEYARWSLRGGFAADFALHLGNFVFPLGTNRVSRFDVLSGGAVEPLPRGTSAAIYAAREQASLVPGVSRFWSADADDGAKVLRWDRVFAGRDSTGEYTAEMRFFQNGDFTTRSNEVETAYRRVNPDDWDDDGVANERDLNPLFCDGDFYGVANALPSNANQNTYYWLDLCATGALGVATIRVTCDGPSDLGDHLIIARTNDVCHIPLLAGATYAVESDLPVGYLEVSSEYAEIATNSETSLTVSLPIELSFERVQTRGGSDNYIAHTTPIDVGPRIVDISGGCCSCVTNDLGFSWDCFPQCVCGGSGHSLSCAAEWEGYSHPFYWRGRCHCYYEDQAAIDEIESRGVSLEILDASGNAIEWKYPVLVGESVIVEATVGGSEMTVSDFVGLFGGRIRLKAYHVDFDGAHDIAGAVIPISAATATSQERNVFRVSVAAGWLQSNGIVRNADDGIDAKTSVDMADGPDGGSDRVDSDSFDSHVTGRLYGRARGRWGGNEDTAIPEGEFNLKTVQAAGTASLVALCGTSSSTKKQCQQQADLFYYSGHGEHDTGRLYGTTVPADVTNLWRDVDTVVFAGCAVLDIGDRGNHYSNPASHSASPGVKWAASAGAGVLLGYCWKAPLDNQGAVRILNDWCSNRTALGDVESWMQANANRNGRNACAIQHIDDSHCRYWYFKREKGYIYNSYSLTNSIEAITR